ncbi:small subunit rRNA processing factor, putative [Plasmodium ovale]|uniref:Small subunit rRNA processing factor, putative n=1 Tax=Plasmodium ovale TaxID=36330 RepID=A0A1D3UAE1_PLAOA|nr:small subunit rRNA processing factor, putative [Plasmodium ovale]
MAQHKIVKRNSKTKSQHKNATQNCITNSLPAGILYKVSFPNMKTQEQRYKEKRNKTNVDNALSRKGERKKKKKRNEEKGRRNNNNMEENSTFKKIYHFNNKWEGKKKKGMKLSRGNRNNPHGRYHVDDNVYKKSECREYRYDNNSLSGTESEGLKEPVGELPCDSNAYGENSRNIDDTTGNIFESSNNMDNIDYGAYIKMMEEKNAEESHAKNASRELDEENIGNSNEKKVFKIFLLFAPLAITSMRNKSCVINADDHMELFKRNLKNVESLLKVTTNYRDKLNLEKKKETIKSKLDNIRIDILFFTLLCLRDCTINKKKKLQIYIHTLNGILIYVSPSFRVPRNFSLFKKVMLNLMRNNVVTDENRTPLLRILPHPVKHYVGSSVCVGISNNGFPTDAKKLSDNMKRTENEYSFFLSLSNTHDVSHFIQLIKKKEGEYFPFDYVVRLSDLKLSTVAICSKLTYFLN